MSENLITRREIGWDVVSSRYTEKNLHWTRWNQTFTNSHFISRVQISENKGDASKVNVYEEVFTVGEKWDSKIPLVFSFSLSSFHFLCFSRILFFLHIFFPRFQGVRRQTENYPQLSLLFLPLPDHSFPILSHFTTLLIFHFPMTAESAIEAAEKRRDITKTKHEWAPDQTRPDNWVKKH